MSFEPSSARIMFVQTSSGTVANTTTETAVTSTGVGSQSLPAGFLTQGRTIRVRGWGVHSALLSPTFTLKIYLGTTAVLSTGAITSINDTNGLIALEADITCRTTGAGGTVFGQGIYTEDGITLNEKAMVNTTTSTIDTTIAQIVAVKATWGTASASNTITVSNLIIEALN